MATSEIVSYCVSAFVSIITIVANIIALQKKGKKAKISSIIANIAFYVSQAEQIFGKGCGPAKLQWVLTKVKIDCVQANVDIDESVIKQEVETILEAPQKKIDSEDVSGRIDVQN